MSLSDARCIAFPSTAADAPSEELSRADGDLDLFEHCLVRPGARFALDGIDPDFCGVYDSPESAQLAIRHYRRRLDRLHHAMREEDRRSVLVILQGLGASGKNGVVRLLLSSVNPAGCRVVEFRQRDHERPRHDFLWRVHSQVPQRGEMAVFHRSHYEDILAVRVHRMVSADSCRQRFDLINQFEHLLGAENRTTVLKFLLHISKQEQLARFRRRLDDPERRWKVSEAHYREHEYWDDYMAAFEDMLNGTSTVEAPWFVIPSNRKWFRDLAVLRIIVRAMEGLGTKVPGPAVDFARIRRNYHEVEAESEAKAS